MRLREPRHLVGDGLVLVAPEVARSAAAVGSLARRREKALLHAPMPRNASSTRLTAAALFDRVDDRFERRHLLLAARRTHQHGVAARRDRLDGRLLCP